MTNKKRLIIVTGARGILGRAYIERLKEMPDTVCVGMARASSGLPGIGVPVLEVDLLDAAAVAACLSTIDVSYVQEVVLLHPVGKFKFEKDGKPQVDEGGDGIDDDVYRSNVDTFCHVVHPLFAMLDQWAAHACPVSIKLCAFGSVSDPYEVPYWPSYTKAKKALRSFMRSLVGEKRGHTVRSLFINLSSVNTVNEQGLRPSADRTYWLDCKEIVDQTLPLLFEQKVFWQEVDLFKPDPSVDSDYYRDHKRVLEKWMRETQPRP